MSC
ncbi:hypothetical protein CP8484711_0981A, partial [Chlamydia psittaci 84-8471/1]|jgi:hypothetical protein